MITDNNQTCQYWPFPINEAEKQLPEEAVKIEFLESAYLDGFQSYRDSGGLDCYGAKSESRSGVILQRARKNRWEFRLYNLGKNEKVDRQFTAFVTDFRVAGIALRTWLNERSISDIIDNISEYLTVPPGLECSYTIHDAKSQS
jgi:hypothetical protein